MTANINNHALLPGWEIRSLGEVVRPARPRIKSSEKSELPFVGMEHVEAHTMKLLGTVPAGTMKSSAVHFQPGDVLYGRLRPYLNKETEQHRIVAEVDRRLSFIREVKSQVDANLQRAERLRQSVLGSAFKGSLDVAEPQHVGELFPYE